MYFKQCFNAWPVHFMSSPYANIPLVQHLWIVYRSQSVLFFGLTINVKVCCCTVTVKAASVKARLCGGDIVVVERGKAGPEPGRWRWSFPRFRGWRAAAMTARLQKSLESCSTRGRERQSGECISAHRENLKLTGDLSRSPARRTVQLQS